MNAGPNRSQDADIEPPITTTSALKRRIHGAIAIPSARIATSITSRATRSPPRARSAISWTSAAASPVAER